ncbi:hypothetical protein [Streptomyces sp. NPDC053048]|uniref:hypothetical protein n=1 Tax=Streptomyces sp. NPDC053048 TaxID=3365694 RepID=UPI0037D8B745
MTTMLPRTAMLSMTREPTPAEGCDVCTALAKQREEARRRGNRSKVTDTNVEIARHPHARTRGGTR